MLMLGTKPVSPGYFPFKTVEKVSDCILEIPQNIKLTLDNNVLTLKAGSTVVLTNKSVYTTITTTQDYSTTLRTSVPDNKYWASFSGSGITADWLSVSSTGSGYALPEDNSKYNLFFLINNNYRSYYLWSNENQKWNTWNNNGSYPLCILEKQNGSWNFAKDSNGNDMIFNNMGYIGHHIFSFPNTKVLIPNGKINNDYNSIEFTTNKLLINELPTSYTSSNRRIWINSSSLFTQTRSEVETYDDLSERDWIYQYVKSENKYYQHLNNTFNEVYATNIGYFSYDMDNDTIIDFTIKQPIQIVKYLIKPVA